MFCVDPPGFLRAIESKEMLPGTAVRFVSVIKGGEPISVIWYKNGQEIRPTRNCSMSFIERTATLLLDAVNLGASGEYICEAVNPAGKETCKAVLSIKEPATYLKRPEDTTVTSGQTARISCTFSGAAGITAAWYRQNRLVKPGNKYCIISSQAESTLEILNTEKADEGTYNCKIQNDAGDETCFVILTVLGWFSQILCIISSIIFPLCLIF
uniref:Ig-like domain-containing protein n=1 Tax=Eptatretus burgeri TaxID=7764 RepID=A0A8C4QV76_EPTBU